MNPLFREPFSQDVDLGLDLVPVDVASVDLPFALGANQVKVGPPMKDPQVIKYNTLT